MKGFGAFRETTTVDLTDVDLFALVGSTGSGKSTIIDAITFALFGSIARYDDNRMVAPIVNQTSNEARVALRFELSGKEYLAARVVRRTPKGATTKEARLERGSEILAADARTMSKAVEDLLGLDVDQFNRTVVLPQGRFADFLHDDPARRQATLRQLLGLDVYARIGQSARQLAKRYQDQGDVLRGDLEAEAPELTDERREQLQARLPAIDTARQQYEQARAALVEVGARLTSALAAAATAEHQLSLLTGIEAPPQVAELDAALTEAVAAESQAAEQLRHGRSERQAARAAVEAGPDRVALSALLQRHDQLLTLSATVEECDRHVGELTTELQALQVRTEVIRRTQQELDSAVQDARDLADRSRTSMSEAPSVAQLDGQLQLQAAHADNLKRLELAVLNVASAAESVAAAQAEVDAVESAVESLQDVVNSLRERVGIASHAATLAIGEPCPLCLQEVHRIPEHHVGAEFKDAEAQLSAAMTALKPRIKDLDRLKEFANRSAAELESANRDLQRSSSTIESIPPTDELQAQRSRAAELADRVAALNLATQEADAAAKAHREDETNRHELQLESVLSSQLLGAQGEHTAALRQLTEAEAGLHDSLTRDECVRLEAEALVLAQALSQSEARERTLETLHNQATESLRTAQQQLTSARSELTQAREALAVLGPPPIVGTSLADDWGSVVAWAESTRRSLRELHNLRSAEATSIDGDRAEIAAIARREISSALAEEIPALPFERIGELLAARETSAKAAIATFEQEQKKYAALRQRVDDLADQEAVARKLGHLLRSDGFEGWLMQSALEQLAGGATARLFELSGGQYSLVLQDRAFAVRDHNNADEIRGARTLSGGETFLASLSLALALATATAELAPDGAPQIDSIFLDEGFGTLDPQTLDTVASAIEELGASGRMVGIVTHIRELADRMPVRLEVTKTGGASRVERVEV